ACAMGTDVILVDEPMPLVRRITMNRPDKRNSLIHALRGAILDTLRAHDQDPDVAVTIIRGAGPSFSAGYDLGGGNVGLDMPFYTPAGEGAWPRTASSWFRPRCCSSASGSSTVRWTQWVCAPGSGPAPSCARSARTPRRCAISWARRGRRA